MKKLLKKLVDLLSGKKTYFIALAGVVYGLYMQDNELVLTALGLAGLRNGVTSEVVKLVSKKK